MQRGFKNDRFFDASTSAGNAFVLTNNWPRNVYYEGFVCTFKSPINNTGTATVNVHSLGIKDITYPDGNPLISGEIMEDRYISLRYNEDEDRFEYINPAALRFYGSSAPGATDPYDGCLFIGPNVGQNLTNGYQVTVVGVNAGVNITDAVESTIFGYAAGYNLTTGNSNLLIGHKSGYSLIDGANNTFFGNGAGQSNNGSENTFAGHQAGKYCVGSYNTFIGRSSGSCRDGSDSNTYAISNSVCIGWSSGRSLQYVGDAGLVLIGYNAGYTLSTGINNTITGSNAGYNLLVGSNNTFYGYQAGYNSTASDNDFIGYQAGWTNTSGTRNVYVGNQAGFSSNDTSDNTCIGYQAGRNFIGEGFCAIGSYAGYSSQTGDCNTLVGAGTGRYNVHGYSNVLIGYYAGGHTSSTSGNNNVYIGETAGYHSISSANVYIGYEAGYNNSSGGNNVFIGYDVGYQNTGGYSNVFIGYEAGYNNSSGGNNVFIGYETGYDNATAYGNLYIGHQAGKINTSSSNVILGAYACSEGSSSESVIVGWSAGIEGNNSNSVVIGNSAGYYSSGTNNVYIGYDSADNCIGNDNTMVGSCIVTDFADTVVTQETSGNARGIWGDGTYIYVADYSSGVHAFTFNGTSWSLIDTYNTDGNAFGVWGDGTYIYVVDYDYGVHAFTFNGTSWSLIDTYDTPGFAQGIWGDGTYIYVADHISGVHAFTFNGTSWSLIDTYDTPGNAYGIWGDGTYIYVADGTSGVHAFTFNGTSWSLIDTYALGNARVIWGDGTYIYITDYSSGVHAFTFNGSSFSIPVIYTPSSFNYEVWGDGTYIYVANEASGVLALTFNGSSWSLIATYNTDGSARGIWGDGTYIYVADYGSGVLAISSVLASTASGSRNTYIGSGAGQKNVGDKNVFIGDKAGIKEIDANNKLIIANGSDEGNQIIVGDFDTGIITAPNMARGNDIILGAFGGQIFESAYIEEGTGSVVVGESYAIYNPLYNNWHTVPFNTTLLNYIKGAELDEDYHIYMLPQGKYYIQSSTTTTYARRSMRFSCLGPQINQMSNSTATATVTGLHSTIDSNGTFIIRCVTNALWFIKFTGSNLGSATHSTTVTSIKGCAVANDAPYVMTIARPASAIVLNAISTNDYLSKATYTSGSTGNPIQISASYLYSLWYVLDDAATLHMYSFNGSSISELPSLTISNLIYIEGDKYISSVWYGIVDDPAPKIVRYVGTTLQNSYSYDTNDTIYSIKADENYIYITWKDFSDFYQYLDVRDKSTFDLIDSYQVYNSGGVPPVHILKVYQSNIYLSIEISDYNLFTFILNENNKLQLISSYNDSTTYLAESGTICGQYLIVHTNSSDSKVRAYNLEDPKVYSVTDLATGSNTACEHTMTGVFENPYSTKMPYITTIAVSSAATSGSSAWNQQDRFEKVDGSDADWKFGDTKIWKLS